MRGLRALAFGVALLAVPAQADTVAELRSELSALSAEVATLARELSSGEAAEQPGFDGSLIDRVERIREELARLTGRTEELEFRIRRAIDEASNRLGDLEFRLTELEGGDTSELAPARPLGGAEPDSAPQPELAAGEQAAFDEGRALAEDGQYDAAAEALAQFLDLYPGSPLSADATRLLAEAHRARGAESEAARAFLNLYLADTEGASAPGALLALGESLGRLDQRDEACVMFDELRERFPDSAETAQADEARARLDCP